MKLLHGFRPSTFLLQDLKFPMLLIENGLFGIKHQAIGRTHKSTSMYTIVTSAHATRANPGGASPPFWVGMSQVYREWG